MVNPFAAVKYLVEDGSNPVYLEIRRGTKGDLWAITRGSEVWNFETNDWEYEPMPSSRSTKFIKQTRMDFEFALSTAIQLFKMVAVLS